ncbi:2-hydroxy-3-oxopropionate reductase [Serratia marcescens]|uniref:2-hydroxy-3-oxopropionate reductase n=2 Tax=Serratia marcescens TaxID=615 RepID=UPI000F7F03C7|nr:2-hydroxy-3-oxopropionate reductase [Serratia marcescens]RTF88284.1 2-hydroxy-3-oxopropionate reductase [Serratia marcescens]RTG49874.1 2-hydroxy-3-oxopropionate reductase [Serratia marcescens]
MTHPGNYAVCVIGLGAMGMGAARSCLRAGLTTYGADLNPQALAALQQAGAQQASTSARDFAAELDAVLLLVVNAAQVKQILFGEQGLAPQLKPGTAVMVSSTISADDAKQIEQRLLDYGLAMLDAPVSGGEVGAKQGTLTIMVGGEQATFERVQPLLALMGKNITLIGGNGDGQTCKVANQIIVALTIEAVSEALVFASRAGADPARVREALMGGFASSRILEVHGERMIKRAFAPGFRISLHQKDLNLALQGAKALALSLPNTATCQELFNVCAANGDGELDHSALVRALEIMGNHRVAG